MAKTYFLNFGSGDPSANSALSPTMTVFKTAGGSAITAPGITQIPTSTGLFYFSYGVTSPMAFVVDGGSSLASPSRYIVGSLDPNDAIDEQLSATGATILSAITLSYGLSVTGMLSLDAKIGSTASSFGGTAVDPGTLYGYLKRLQEFNEGNSTFNKSTGVWDIYSRGSSTLLIEKTLSDAASTVTKT